MASAGPYASLHLAPDSYPCQHPTTQFFTGRECFFWYHPTQVVLDKGLLNGCVHVCESEGQVLLWHVYTNSIRCSLLLLMYCGLSVSQGEVVNATKTAEPIKVPFGCGLGWSQQPYVRRGLNIPRNWVNFGGHTWSCPDLPTVNILNLIQ